ncbi:MAG: ATP-binding protein [Bacteroidales bacterium]|nr:ATP-binding protein [Bacteroidales bacterium]
MNLNRALRIDETLEDSIFLWGARQTGKSTLLKMQFPNASYYDLLKSDEYLRLSGRPALLREECEMLREGDVVIIDEVQKLPVLLDEVHWLIENKGLRFILCGSSARKLKRCGANLLGGRALRMMLYPLTSAEIPDFDIDKALNQGLLPRHYLAANATKRLEAYVGDYLQQEIIAESIVRQVNSFTRFLQAAALSNAEIVNYTNIAQDCGVSAKTVKEYFTILEDTLIGYFMPAYAQIVKRKLIAAPKFYFFDVALPTYILGRAPLRKGTVEYGHAFEHLIFQELKAYLSYSDKRKQLTYWRTIDNRYEVDFVIGNAEAAIEVKSSANVVSADTKGLRAFAEEYPQSKLMIVSMESRARIHNGITIYPVMDFFRRLWAGEII